VDALTEQVDVLIEAVTADHDHSCRRVSFRVPELGQEHRVSFARSGRDVVVLVDRGEEATLALVVHSYPHLTAVLRRWADRVEAIDTE